MKASLKALIVVLGIAYAVGFGLLGYGIAHPPKADRNPCTWAFEEGWKRGALTVINHDVQAQGLPPYRSWEEFEDTTRSSRARMAGLQAFFDEIDRDRTARNAALNATCPEFDKLKGPKWAK